MKNMFCLGVVLSLFFASCSSSDDSSVTNEDDVLLMKTIETYPDDGSTVTTNYSYNGMKMASLSDSDGFREVYNYTGDLITNVKFYDDTNTLIAEEDYNYNGSEQLTIYVLKNYESGQGRKETFIHNANNTISYSLYGGDTTTQTNLSETGTITFTDGELISVNISHSSGITYTATRTYSYDAKNNPFKNVVGFDKISFINEEAFGIAHNIVTEQYSSSLSTNESFTTTYTYNSLNFPSTGSEMDDSDTTNVISTQYFYN